MLKRLIESDQKPVYNMEKNMDLDYETTKQLLKQDLIDDVLTLIKANKDVDGVDAFQLADMLEEVIQRNTK